MATLSAFLPTPRAWRTAIAASMLLGLAPAQAGADERAIEAMVFRAFPEADSYKRIVRDVDAKARTEIEGQLPFKVHFNELGPHTLFVAFRGLRPVGLVYLRSEEAEWGLVEIAWALNLDLRVLGFQFLRGRSRHLEALEQSTFAKNLIGRDFVRVVEQLRRKGASDPNLVPAGAEELAKTVLRSCAKALLVTDTVWREEVAKLQDQATGFQAFPAATGFGRRVGKFDLGVGDSHQSVAVKVIYAHGANATQLGSVIRTEAQFDGDHLVLRWVLDPQRRITRVMLPQSWDNTRWRVACTQLEGHALASPPGEDNPLGPLAQGLGALLEQLDATKARK